MRMTHLVSIIFGADGYFKNIHWHLFCVLNAKRPVNPYN